MLGNELGVRYGAWARTLFLVGFFAVTWTSLLGVWNGVSLLFADFVRVIKLPHGAVARSARDEPGYDAPRMEKSAAFRFYLVWLTVPPMTLLFFDRPFQVTLIYGVLGAAFMPFLAVTLLVLLHSRLTPPSLRPGLLSTLMLAITAALFVTLSARISLRGWGSSEIGPGMSGNRGRWIPRLADAAPTFLPPLAWDALNTQQSFHFLDFIPPLIVR